MLSSIHQTSTTRAFSRRRDLTPIIDARVVLLTHYIPLYQVRVFQELARRVRELKILLSTPLEPNRRFQVDWADLDVTVQRGVTLRRRWRHRAGFDDPLFIHVPYDTYSQLSKYAPDIVLSHELGARSIISAMYRRLHPKSRLLFLTYMSEHTEQGRGLLRGFTRQALLRMADGITYNGPSCQRYLQSLGVDSRRQHHFPYAADDRVSAVLPEGGEMRRRRERMICVGQLSERKGVALLLEQLVAYCASRPHRDIELMFVGDGPLTSQLASKSTPANLHVSFLGSLTQQEVAELYHTCGVALHATLADEWLLVVEESMRCGLPFIGSRYSQAVETLVSEDSNGWTFDPLVAGDLASKLDLYFQASDERIRQMRAAARTSVAHRTPAWAARNLTDAIRAVMLDR